MRLVLINHYAGSPRHGMEYRPFYLCREWVRSGHTAVIIAASFSHLRIEQPRMDHVPITEEEVQGVHYLWLNTPEYSGNSLGRARNMAAFLAGLLRYGGRWVRRFRPDVVIASSTYPMDIYPARRMARLAGAKLVFELHDIWPLSPLELGVLSPRSPLVPVIQHAEDYACRHADRIISILPKAAEHLEARGMAAEKFVHIPNGIDPDEWGGSQLPLPDLHARALEQWRAEGRFVLGYAGSHGRANALEALIDAAARLKHEPLAVVLVGQGPEKPMLQQRTDQLELRHVKFLPPVPKAAVPCLLSALDALYLGWRDEPVYRFGVSPNKLMDYMMSARPIVHAVRAGNDLVAQSACGISCAPEDPEAAARAILEMMRLPAEERAAMGRRGREYVLQHHDYRLLARRFLEAVV